MTTPSVSIGDIIKIAEPDYRYGRGPLRLRVTEIGPIERHDDGLWIALYGIELNPDGRAIDPRPRWALVRVRALTAPPRHHSANHDRTQPPG